MSTNNHTPKTPQRGGADTRSDMRKHQYKDHDEVLTNDENYDVDTQKFKGEKPDWDDKLKKKEKNS